MRESFSAIGSRLYLEVHLDQRPEANLVNGSRVSQRADWVRLERDADCRAPGRQSVILKDAKLEQMTTELDAVPSGCRVGSRVPEVASQPAYVQGRWYFVQDVFLPIWNLDLPRLMIRRNIKCMPLVRMLEAVEAQVKTELKAARALRPA